MKFYAGDVVNGETCSAPLDYNVPGREAIAFVKQLQRRDE